VAKTRISLSFSIPLINLEESEKSLKREGLAQERHVLLLNGTETPQILGGDH
jgi:hypothetical protein